MPTVAIAHSPDRNRSLETTYSLVREALAHLGGFEAFVKPGQRVLLRPDQNSARLAEDGATTDPLLIGVLIRLSWEAGAASVQVAAASSSRQTAAECMRLNGVTAIAKQEGAELLDLSDAGVPDSDVSLAEGVVLKRARLPEPLLNNDVIIAVPKARTDSQDLIAGSLEFCSGSLNKHWHVHHGNEQNLMGQLADVMTVVRPDLWITDALICGEGDGPHATAPHWCGCVMASPDPVATDYAAAMLLGHDPIKLRFAKALEERGLGFSAPIVFLGAPVGRFAFRAWPSHRDFAHFPVDVLIGGGVTEEGTVRQVKQALDIVAREGLLQRVLHHVGTPTMLIGDADDQDFEEHLKRGPYVVWDDAASPKYRNHPSVFFVPGHPVPESATEALQHILRRFDPQWSSSTVSALTLNNRGLAAGIACAGIGLMLCLESKSKR